MIDELREGINSLNKRVAVYAKSIVVSVAPARTRLLLTEWDPPGPQHHQLAGRFGWHHS